MDLLFCPVSSLRTVWGPGTCGLPVSHVPNGPREGGSGCLSRLRLKRYGDGPEKSSVHGELRCCGFHCLV